MNGPVAVGSILLAVGVGASAIVAGRPTASPLLMDDPVEAVETAIEMLSTSRDVDRATDLIYAAIESEGRSRSGIVDSLHLQSAALRLSRGDVPTALTYLDLALRFDDHAPMHDPQAFGVPASGAPFVPAWPLTLVSAALVGAAVVWVAGRRSSRSRAA